MSAAARCYHINNLPIARACNNIEYTAANHHWQWADEPPIDPANVPPIRPRGRRPVRCIETGVVYSSIIEAAVDIGVSRSGIYSTCTGNCKTIKELHFEFVDPDGKIQKESRRNTALVNRVPVLCVETGVRYESMREAAESVGVRASYICAVCNGRAKTAGGYHWRRLDREYVEPTELEIKTTWVKVRCTTTGVVYNSIRAAAQMLNLDNSSISKVCRGKLKATKGLHFEYVN